MRATRTRNAVAAVLAGALMAVASPVIAHAQAPLSPDPTPVRVSDLLSGAAAGPYALKNVNSQLYAWPGENNAVGAIIRQDGWSGLAHQVWTTVPDGVYTTFWNSEGSGLNMGINNASMSAGALAIQANGSSHANQDWRLELRSGSDTQFQMRNRHSNLCLGISGGSMSPGAQAAQFTCDGRANQTWVANPVDS